MFAVRTEPYTFQPIGNISHRGSFICGLTGSFSRASANATFWKMPKSLQLNGILSDIPGGLAGASSPAGACSWKCRTRPVLQRAQGKIWNHSNFCSVILLFWQHFHMLPGLSASSNIEKMLLCAFPNPAALTSCCLSSL